MQVHYPGDPTRFYTRFDSNTSRDDLKGPTQLQLPGTTSMVDRNLTPLESMESMISMIHPVHRESCLVFQKGSNKLKEETPPRQVLERKWMWENILQAMPIEAADVAKRARKHQLPVELCAPNCCTSAVFCCVCGPTMVSSCRWPLTSFLMSKQVCVGKETRPLAATCSSQPQAQSRFGEAGGGAIADWVLDT